MKGFESSTQETVVGPESAFEKALLGLVAMVLGMGLRSRSLRV